MDKKACKVCLQKVVFNLPFLIKFLIVSAVFLLKYNFITNVYSETLLSKINEELAVNGLYA